MWLHNVSDALIGLAYFAIPVLLVSYIHRRKDLPFSWMFWLFAAFLVGCGTTHLMEVVTTYVPMYRLAGVIKLLTAAVSLVTAVTLVPLVPRALLLRSPTVLEEEIGTRRRAQEMAERQAALLDLVHDAILVRDWERRVTSWNRGAEELYGWTREQAIGQTTQHLFQTHFPRPLAEIEEEVFRVGQWEGELRHTRRDGTTLVVASRWALQRDGQGRPLAILEINRDITQRQRTEEELQQSEERFRLLVEGVQDYAIYLLDLDGRVLTWNVGAERIKGYTTEEVVGRHFSLFYPPEAIDKGWPEHELTVAGREGRFEDEGWRVRKNGSRFWANVIVTALRDERGNLKGFSKITRDLTERKRAEERTEAFAIELQRSNRELEQFASVASHDLQEPLRKIRAFGDRLQARFSEALGEQGRQYIERMQSAASRMQTLIDDLLTYSRVTSKAQPFGNVDLAQEVRQVIADLETRLHQTGGRVEVGSLPTLPADATQMRQLFQNLIGNALKFHKPSEPPVVLVEAKRSAIPGGSGPGENGDHYEITVRDNGIGFEPEYRHRIFQLFQRLHGRSEYEGTGIGLAVCKKIVERHGGTITATSAPGAGTTFTIILPCQRAEEKRLDD